jgi:2'-5' RNA ligase
MKTIVNSIPGYQASEYLLVIEPHKELTGKIAKIKEEFADAYKMEQARWGQPQILLASFVQYAMMEERLINRLRMVAMGATPFKTELRDFGSFPSHTIYINVVSKVPFQGLVKNIRHETQRLMKLNDDNKPYFNLEPHITIARKLQPWQYEKGWLEYSNRSFTGRFIADTMVLLKRPVAKSSTRLCTGLDFRIYRWQQSRASFLDKAVTVTNKVRWVSARRIKSVEAWDWFRRESLFILLCFKQTKAKYLMSEKLKQDHLKLTPKKGSDLQMIITIMKLSESNQYLQGRGAQFNTKNKFLKNEITREHIEGIDDWSDENTPTQYLEAGSKTIVNKVDSPDLRMMYSMNPYAGCEHGCIYCYARNVHEYWGYSAGLDFERKIIVKKNAPALLRKFLMNPKWDATPIMLSGNTDCYQPAEQTYRLTRSLLEVCNEFNQAVSILTKNAWILKDKDVLQEMAKKRIVSAMVSVTSFNEDLRRVMEPRTTTAKQKLKIINELSSAGVRMGVMMGPMIPRIE